MVAKGGYITPKKMPRGPSISIRDRLIVWDCCAKGINSSRQIRERFDELGEREISEDLVRKLIKEYETFLQLLPEYPDLQRELAGQGITRSLLENRLKRHWNKVIEYLKKWREDLWLPPWPQNNWYTRKSELEIWFPRFDKHFPRKWRIEEERFFANSVKSHYEHEPLWEKAEKFKEMEKNYIEACACLMDEICEVIKKDFGYLAQDRDELGVLDFYPITVYERAVNPLSPLPRPEQYKMEASRARKDSEQLEAKLLKLEGKPPLASGEKEEELEKLREYHLNLMEVFRESKQAQKVRDKYKETADSLYKLLEELEDEIIKGKPPGRCKYCKQL